MTKEGRFYELERLNKCIDEVREILNEISCTLVDSEIGEEVLIISKCLDELIVEYIKREKEHEDL